MEEPYWAQPKTDKVAAMRGMVRRDSKDPKSATSISDSALPIPAPRLIDNAEPTRENVLIDRELPKLP
jgi:hypothetical protein